DVGRAAGDAARRRQRRPVGRRGVHLPRQGGGGRPRRFCPRLPDGRRGMSEYIYTDPYQYELRFAPSSAVKTDVEISCDADSGVDVPVADLPEVVAKLYRAAGQEPPILLPRYKPEPEMTRDGKVRAGIRPSRQDMTPAAARDMASWYATAAELATVEALSQPDPAQVAALAEGIRDLAERHVLTTDDGGQAVARAILAAGYARAAGPACGAVSAASRRPSAWRRCSATAPASRSRRRRHPLTACTWSRRSGRAAPAWWRPGQGWTPPSPRPPASSATTGWLTSCCASGRTAPPASSPRRGRRACDAEDPGGRQRLPLRDPPHPRPPRQVRGPDRRLPPARAGADDVLGLPVRA